MIPSIHLGVFGQSAICASCRRNESRALFLAENFIPHHRGGQYNHTRTPFPLRPNYSVSLTGYVRDTEGQCVIATSTRPQ